LGGSIERLIGLASGVSTELDQLERRVLLPPGDWPFQINHDQWTPFLRKLGVHDGLAPIAGSNRARARPSEFKPERVARDAGVPLGLREDWIAAVNSRGGKASQGNGVYGNRSAFCWLPGQADFPHMSPKARLE